MHSGQLLVKVAEHPLLSRATHGSLLPPHWAEPVTHRLRDTDQRTRLRQFARSGTDEDPGEQQDDRNAERAPVRSPDLALAFTRAEFAYSRQIR